MFGPLGGFELLVLAAIGLLVFGPRRLPEIGRTIGRTMLQFRRAASDLRNSIEREVDFEEVKKTTQTIQREVRKEIEELDPGRMLETAETVDKKEDERAGGGGERE